MLDIYNAEDVEKYLEKLALEKSSDIVKPERLASLLKLALLNVLKKEHTACQRLEKLPSDAPKWLVEKWNLGYREIYSFNSSLLGAKESEIEHIADWIRSSLVNREDWVLADRPRKLENIGSLGQANNLASKYSKLVASRVGGGLEPNLGTKSVLDFDDGFSIRRLVTPEALIFEGSKLKHCVGEGSYNQREICSLRSPEGSPLLTIEIKNGQIVQVKGVLNQIVSEKQLPYVLELIKQKNLKVADRPQHTGIVTYNKEIYWIGDLPEGFIYNGNLDISVLNEKVVLPRGLRVKGRLSLKAKKLSSGASLDQVLKENDIVLPDEIEVDEFFFAVVTKGKKFNPSGPTYLNFSGKTKKIIAETWCEERENFVYRKKGPSQQHFDSETGGLVSITYTNAESENHREEGPAHLEWDAETRELIREEWCLNKFGDRKNGPAIYGHDLERKTKLYQYMRSGKLHNEDGPAMLEIYAPTMKVLSKSWYIDGKKHRDEGPAEKKWDIYGNLLSEEWCNKGSPEREVKYNPVTGLKTQEKWRRSFNLHRLDGPALREWDHKGKVTKQEWRIEGELIENPRKNGELKEAYDKWNNPLGIPRVLRKVEE